MSVLNDLGEFLRSGIRRYNVPGASIAVLRNGRLAAAEAAGVINLNTRVQTDTDSVFQIGSITKIFTTTLILQLQDEGLLDINAPVIDYLPQFRVADPIVCRELTLRHFLSHTSGIDGDFFPDSGRGDGSVERFVDMCAMLPQLFQPGAMMSYCNVGFAVLGRVIEILTGKTYDAAIAERLFAPLGMDHALSLPEDTLRFRSAIGHVPHPRKKGVLRVRVAPALFLSQGQKAAGSTPSMSASDLLRFAYAHMNGGRGANGTKILSASSVNAMRARQVRLLKHTRILYRQIRLFGCPSRLSIRYSVLQNID